MKGPFSIWGFFGLTIWIDTFTHALYEVKGDKQKKIDPYNPVREVSVIIPAHKEGKHIEKTIRALYNERYPLKNIIVCSDKESTFTKEVVESLLTEYDTLYYLECPHVSKSKKINYAVKVLGDVLGEFVYVRDSKVTGNYDCIERMIPYFTDEKVAAVTSYGRLSVPKNFLSRSYYYGKSWINEIGRFRKNAQVKRQALFVVCGASTMYRRDVLKKIPIPYGTKTEDTHYTWKLQMNGYRVNVADDAVASAPELDGEGLNGIKNQIKQSYRWSAGTVQCIYREGRKLPKNKRLFYTTILPGFLEALSYSTPLILLPMLLIFYPFYAGAFLVGDTVFSLAGTVVLMPKKFWKTLLHYPQIFFFKYLNAAIFLYAFVKVTAEAVAGKTRNWHNEWTPLQTDYVLAK
ncbi:MAG: glycosyltransferase family 2 protein [Candidatus Nanoarchaeia archaeon]